MGKTYKQGGEISDGGVGDATELAESLPPYWAEELSRRLYKGNFLVSDFNDECAVVIIAIGETDLDGFNAATRTINALMSSARRGLSVRPPGAGDMITPNIMAEWRDSGSERVSKGAKGAGDAGGLADDPKIEEIAAVGKMLDEKDVPTEGRQIHFTGKDGKTYAIALDKNIDQKMLDQLPDSKPMTFNAFVSDFKTPKATKVILASDKAREKALWGSSVINSPKYKAEQAERNKLLCSICDSLDEKVTKPKKLRLSAKLEKRLKSVLIHCIGDTRRCRHCDGEFIPQDDAQRDALKLYKKLFPCDQ